MNPQINIVIPLYNEEKVFPYLIKRLNRIINEANFVIEVILIDDGSRDNTSYLMSQLSLENNKYTSVFLARNHGHQKALTAGLNHVNSSEGVFIIDGDLQDPPELLFDFKSKFESGFDVVYGIRKKRKESWIKKTAYFTFYRILGKISNINIPIDSGDFAFISNRVVNVMNSMPEESRYLRGMRSWIGFKQTGLIYERDARVAGEPKYNFKMLLSLAYDGVFNFSSVPIKVITAIGAGGILISFSYFIFVLIKKIFTSEVPSGFTALLFMVIFFGCIQLLCIGVLGEYMMRIFFQVKGRPLFIVDKVVRNKEIIIKNE